MRPLFLSVKRADTAETRRARPYYLVTSKTLGQTVILSGTERVQSTAAELACEFGRRIPCRQEILRLHSALLRSAQDDRLPLTCTEEFGVQGFIRK